MVKMTGKTSAMLDAEAAIDAEAAFVAEAEGVVRSKQATAMRLLLALTAAIWPSLTQAMKDSIRSALSAQDEASIRAALERLP